MPTKFIFQNIPHPDVFKSLKLVICSTTLINAKTFPRMCSPVNCECSAFVCTSFLNIHLICHLKRPPICRRSVIKPKIL